MKKEWPLIDLRPITMVESGIEKLLVGREEENKLLHIKALLTKEIKYVIIFINTTSSHNIFQKGF